MSNERSSPVIVGFVADLMFQVQIEKVAQQLGYDLVWVDQAEEIRPASPEAPGPRPGEPLDGEAGNLFARLTRWQPALLIFDLDNQQVPWERWIATIKSSPATRRLPILCYGSHVRRDAFKTARSVGSDLVVARSRFTSTLPQLIAEHARKTDLVDLRAACNEPLDPLAREGIALFNEGHYYKAHDALEEAWVADQGAGRDLYRAILQVGIAYFQIGRGNYRGALKMLLRVRQWLDPLPDHCRGVDVARIREDVNNVHEALVDLGPERMDEIDHALFRPVRLIEK